MSPARRDLNSLIIPMFARKFQKGGRVLFIGVDPVWDYKNLFPNCTYETLDIKESRHPDILGDIQGCPEIQDNLYDGIIMTGVYEYLEEPEKAMREIYRILKTNGMFLFCAPGVEYYGQKKPWISIDELPGFLFDFKILAIFISYYKTRDPYYIHTFAEK